MGSSENEGIHELKAYTACRELSLSMPSHTAAAGRPDSRVSGKPCAAGCGCTKALTVVAASTNEDVGMVKKIEHYPELVDL
jgi:hypothetical protein